MLRIILHPAFDHRGRRLHGQFDARLKDHAEVLCVSHQPLLDCARILLAMGVDPETVIATRHAGAAFDAMTATVGAAAKWTVRENETEGPTFRRWRPFPAARVEVPVRYFREPVPDTGQGICGGVFSGQPRARYIKHQAAQGDLHRLRANGAGQPVERIHAGRAA